MVVACAIQQSQHPRSKTKLCGNLQCVLWKNIKNVYLGNANELSMFITIYFLLFSVVETKQKTKKKRWHDDVDDVVHFLSSYIHFVLSEFLGWTTKWFQRNQQNDPPYRTYNDNMICGILWYFASCCSVFISMSLVDDFFFVSMDYYYYFYIL
jgi:hypothetical protein